MSKKVSKLDLLPKKKKKNNATVALKEAAVNGTLRELLWRETQASTNDNITSINFTDFPETEEVFCLLPIIESESEQSNLVVDNRIDIPVRPTEPNKPKKLNSKKESLRSKIGKTPKTKHDITNESNIKVRDEPQTRLESNEECIPSRKRTYTEIMHKLKASTLAAKFAMMELSENEEEDEEEELEEQEEVESSHENEVIDEDERLLSIVEERLPIARKLQVSSIPEEEVQEYYPNTQGSFIWTGIHPNNNHSTTTGSTMGNRKIVNRASMVFELLVMSRKLQEDREVELMKREDRCSCNGRAGYVNMCDGTEEEENTQSGSQSQRKQFRVTRAPSQRSEVPLSVLEFATFWAHLLKEKQKRTTIVQKEVVEEVEEEEWEKERMDGEVTIAEQQEDEIAEYSQESSDEEEVGEEVEYLTNASVVCHRPFEYKPDAAIDPIQLKRILHTESSSDDEEDEEKEVYIGSAENTLLTGPLDGRSDHADISSRDKYPTYRDKSRLQPTIGHTEKASATIGSAHSQPVQTVRTRTASMDEEHPRYSIVVSSHPESLASLSCDSTDPVPQHSSSSDSGSVLQKGREGKDMPHTSAPVRVVVSSRRSTPHRTTSRELPRQESSSGGGVLLFNDSVCDPADESDTSSVETPRQLVSTTTATSAVAVKRGAVRHAPTGQSNIEKKRSSKESPTYTHNQARITAAPKITDCTHASNPKENNKVPIQTDATMHSYTNITKEKIASEEGRLPPGCEHLRGIWPYDPSLQAFNALTQRVVQRRWHSRTQVAAPRKELLPNSPHSENITEVCFDPLTMALVLTSYHNGLPSAVSVALDSIYLTQSIVPDMLTLRTRDRSAVPAGYLGSFFTSQWNNMEKEINTALTQFSHSGYQQRAYLPGDRQSSYAHSSQCHDKKHEVVAKCGDLVSTESEGCGFTNTSGGYDAKQSASPSFSPVFLTEANIEDFTLGSSMWDSVDGMELSPQDVSADQLRQLAALGQTAFHQLSSDARLTAYCEYPQIPHPPPSLSTESILASQGASHSLIIHGGLRQTHRKRSNKKYRKSRLVTDVDIKPIDQSSRFMDLIRGAVEQYKRECKALQQQRALLVNTTIPTTNDREDVVESISSAYTRSLIHDELITTQDPKTLRFYDPFSLKSSRNGEAGYSATGYSALGDAVEIAIAGLAPFAAAAPMASPTIPRRPPQPSPTRASHILRRPTDSNNIPTTVIADVTTAYHDRPIPSSSSTNTITNSPATHRKLVEVPSVTREHTSDPQQQLQMECKSINIDRRTGSPGSLLEASVAAAGEGADAAGKIVLLLESCPHLQLHFAKRFLQLDLAVDVFGTTAEATTALNACTFVYGIILLSLQDLYCSSSASGSSSVEEHLHCTLNRLFPVDVNRSLFTIIVHHSECITEEERLLLHSLGVEMLLPQPYTLSVLKKVVRSHALKRSIATT